MKVLVTGGAGFLGSHVGRQLARAGHRVTVLRRGSRRDLPVADFAERDEVGDVTDLSTAMRVIDGHDVVVHAAIAVTGSPSTAQAYEASERATSSVVETSLSAGIRRLVHVSSVSAIGIPSDTTPATEDFVFNLRQSPLYYNCSKQHTEMLVAAGVRRGLDAVIVNPSALWGPCGDAYRGSDAVRRLSGSRLVRCTAGGVCIAHVSDVADGIVAAIDRGATGERYILGGDNLSYREWTTRIAAALGVNPMRVSLPKTITNAIEAVTRPLAGISAHAHTRYVQAFFAGRSAYYNSSKAIRVLDYKPRSFEEILDECLRFVEASQHYNK